MSSFKKFLICASLILVLIVGNIVAYVFNVDAQKHVEEIPSDNTEIETSIPETTPTETLTETPTDEGTIEETQEESIDRVFAKNSWETIARVFKSGKASEYWNVGDVKEINLSGYPYGLRIVDMTEGRYAYTDGSGRSHGVLQFVQCLSESYPMNETRTNAGGWASCFMRSTLNTIVYEQLPEDLKAVISEVFIASSIGSSTSRGVTYSPDKLFLMSEYELFGVEYQSLGLTEGQPQYSYWSSHNNSESRIKFKSGDSEQSIRYFLRSPSVDSSERFCGVSNAGGVGTYYADTSIYGVCPCFAF